MVERTRNLQTVLPDKLAIELRNLCKKHNISISVFIRFCVEQELINISRFTDDNLRYMLRYLQEYKKDRLERRNQKIISKKTDFLCNKARSL